VRILIVEDSAADARLIEELLVEGGFERGTLERVTTLSEGLARLEQGGVDVALLDLGLPDSMGFETFLRAHRTAPAVPIIVLTGLSGDELAVRAVQEGAQDYLVKGELTARVLWREIHFAFERLRAAEAQRLAEQRLLLLLQSTGEGILGVDLTGAVISCNPAGARMLGYGAPEDLIGRSMHVFLEPVPDGADPAPGRECAVCRAMRAGTVEHFEDELFWRADSTYVPVEYRVNPVRQAGETIGAVVTFADITDRKRNQATAEEQTRIAAFTVDIGAALTGDGDLRRTLARCAQAMVDHLGAAFGRIWTLNPRENVLELQASAGLYTHLDGEHARVPVGRFKIGLIAEERRPHITNDALADPRVSDRDWARRERMVAFAGHPVVVEGDVMGVMAMFSRRPLDAYVITALAGAADSVALFIKRKRDEESKRIAEAQLLQSQKMEAVGRLAGGVAHDFNNLLTAIMGYGQLLSLRLKPGDPGHGEADEILKAATRASVLTRQLLTFSRREVVRLRPLDLNAVVGEMAKLIRRLIGEDVELVVRPGHDLDAIVADAGQIEQVIMNLAVNARDAMPSGGRLTIETSNVHLDASFAGERFGVGPGAYVLLAVSDTGVGMSEETREHLFEPFFTTKGPGQGTGLGLSTAYGIVKTCGGGIQVYSDPGFGTTFKLYFPRTEEAPERVQESGEGRGLVGGDGTILVVEDQDAVSTVIRGALRLAGYHVIVAVDGSQALEILGSQPGTVDLAIVDVIMPDMRGPELARRLRLLRPGTKVLFISGYTEGAFVASEALPPGTWFLRKPFTPETLTAKVRDAIDAEKPASR
jgi:PAS domain S-box-containing protein